VIVNEDFITVIVDGECDFCRRTVAWIRPRLPTPVRFISYQRSDVSGFSLSREQCEMCVHVIGNGSVTLGSRAVAELLSNGSYSLRGAARLIRMFASLSERIYDHIAHHRDGRIARIVAVTLPRNPDPLDDSLEFETR